MTSDMTSVKSVFYTGVKTMRVIGYIRVSTARQADKGLSLEAQSARVHNFAASKGIDAADVSIHVDSGISGGKQSRSKRVALDAALAELKVGDFLVAYSLSRLGRSTKHLIEIVEFVKDAGANLVILDQSIDTSTAAGELLFTMLAGIAQFERTVISERVKSVTETKKNRGEKMGGIAPYGFKSVNNGKPVLVKDDGEQLVITAARQLREAGMSLAKIATELSKRGFKTRKGGAHYAMSVKRMLAA